MKKLISISLMLVLIAGCISLAACGSKSDNGTKTTTAAIKTTEKTTTASSGSGLTWNDMPVYSGAGQIQKGTWSIPPADDADYAEYEWRYYESSASQADVAAYYKSQMPGKGWGQQAWMDMGEVSWGMYYKNDEKDAAMVWVSNQDGKTAIALWRATK